METARIDRFASRTDAELACSMLAAHGFNARVSADDGAGIHPDIPFGIGGTAVVVPRDEYDDAVALLDTRFEGSFDDETSAASATQAWVDDDLHRGGRRRVSMTVALAMAVLLAAIVTASAGVALDWW